jgi:uncharacterized protein DUF3810
VALLPVSLALQLLASRFPALVERGYSMGLYPAIAAAAARLTGRLPFSVAEWVVAAALVLALLGLLRFVLRAVRERGHLRKAWLPALVNVLAVAGVVYAVFVLAWGLNYAREPFAVLAGLDASPARIAELRAACGQLVERANVLREGLPEDPQGVMRVQGGLPGALTRAERGYGEAGAVYGVLAARLGRPKPLLLSPLVSYLGITGIYFPFTGEANVNADVPEPDLPFAISHEMAHQRGFAREDEAGYVGYLACRFHPDADFRYSGALAASVYALHALAGVDRPAHRELARRRSPAVERDLRAMEDWAARHRGRVARVSRSVNNAYLRSQGQAEGVRSYGRMVDLLIAERRPRASAPLPRGSLGEDALFEGGT